MNMVRGRLRLQQLPIPFTTSGDKGNLSYTKTPEGVFSVLTSKGASHPENFGCGMTTHILKDYIGVQRNMDLYGNT